MDYAIYGDRTQTALRVTLTNLGRITSIGTVRGAAVARSFGYGYNAANQRNSVTWEDGSKWTFGYDTLGQVTSGVRKWGDQTLVAGQQFGYDFDSIGNRKTATRNGRTATYTPDTLNQYDSATVPGFVDVTGDATATAKVTVNNQPTARTGTYFYKEEEAVNTASPVLAELKTVAVKSNADAQGRDAVLEATKYAFIPQTPEVFVHDDDGNLTEDGQFLYTWDGENRLIKVETKPAAVAVGAKKVKQEAEFDHRNLRVRLKLSEWISGAWSVKSDLRMLYDGWNVLAELRPDGTIERANTWGLDLSGSEQGAGGVGGALFVSIPDGATRTATIPVYDGNGNITGLLNASTGVTEAQYEYGPFGETLRETGRLAVANVLRWSTKREDSAVGLVHYELRDYTARTGRWVKRDPIGEVGGMNVFGFINNQTNSGVDVAGLFVRSLTPAQAAASARVAFLIAETGLASSVGVGIIIGAGTGRLIGGAFDGYVDKKTEQFFYNTIHRPRLEPVPENDFSRSPNFGVQYRCREFAQQVYRVEKKRGNCPKYIEYKSYDRKWHALIGSSASPDIQVSNNGYHAGVLVRNGIVVDNLLPPVPRAVWESNYIVLDHPSPDGTQRRKSWPNGGIDDPVAFVPFFLTKAYGIGQVQVVDKLSK